MIKFYNLGTWLDVNDPFNHLFFDFLLLTCTVKPVLISHSKKDKTKILITFDSLMNVESIAECSTWSSWKYCRMLHLEQLKVLQNATLGAVESIAESILQFFWSALSDNWYWKPIFGLFESGSFTQVLLCSKKEQPQYLLQMRIWTYFWNV